MMELQATETLFLFAGLSEGQRAILEPLFHSYYVQADTALFEQGDPAEFLYVVLDGEVMITYKPDDAPSITITHVQPGSVVGWSAAIGSRYYTSGAFCTLDSHLLRIRGNDLRSLCSSHPETGGLILDRLATAIAERLHSTHDLVIKLLHMGMQNTIDQPGG